MSSQQPHRQPGAKDTGAFVRELDLSVVYLIVVARILLRSPADYSKGDTQFFCYGLESIIDEHQTQAFCYKAAYG